MARSKRAQVLMEPEEYRRLEEIARREGVSVAELVRTAVRERYLPDVERRRDALARFLGEAPALDLPDWETLEAELSTRGADALS